MTYRGHIKNGQVALNEPAKLPEGAEVNIEVLERTDTDFQSLPNPRTRKFRPIEMPGGPLADDIIHDRR